MFDSMKKIIGLGAIAVIFFLSWMAEAAEMTKGFSISPPVIDISLAPGSTKVFPIELFNKSNTDIAAFKIYSVPINEIKTFSKLKDNKWSCVDWIEALPKTLILSPRKYKAVTVKITVPYGVTPSGRYAVIMFEHLSDELSALLGGEESKEAATCISWRIAALVRLTIIGPGIKKDAEITGFEVLPSDLVSGGEKKEDFAFHLTIKNKGNVHFEVEGDITVRTKQGRRIAGVPVEQFRIYPTLEREIKITSALRLPLGEYTAGAVLSYGDFKSAQATIPFTITSGEKIEEEITEDMLIQKERRIVVTPLSLEPESLVLKMPLESFRTAHFALTNRYDYPVEIISGTGAKNGLGIKLGPETFILYPGATRKVMLEVTTFEKEGEFKTEINFAARNKNTGKFLIELKAELIVEISKLR